VIRPVSTLLRFILEADRPERRLEREYLAGDPEAFFRMAIKKLRTHRHLGELRTEEWQALIDGAKNSGHYVYVITKNVRWPSTVCVRQLIKTVSNDLVYDSADVPNRAPITPQDLVRWGTWKLHSYITTSALVSPVRMGKIVLSRTDFTRVHNGSEIVRGLGIEGMFGD